MQLLPSSDRDTRVKETEFVFQDLQSDAQVLGLNVVKIHKSSNDLIKLVGPDSSAGKRMEKEFEDISTCHAGLCNDALARLKKVNN